MIEGSEVQELYLGQFGKFINSIITYKLLLLEKTLAIFHYTVTEEKEDRHTLQATLVPIVLFPNQFSFYVC